MLPFKDLSPQMDQQHLCSGIPSDLVQRLTQVEGLWIPAWASSSAFNIEDMDIKELGKKLNVDTVLTGTLQKADDKLRITVELINITDNDVIWTERYERDEGGIFELQDDVTLAIIDKLKVKLLGEEKAGLVKRYTDNVEAYNLYLRGRFFWNKRTKEDMLKSIEYFEKAITVDSEYALAYTGIADAYCKLGSWLFLPAKEAYPKAREYVLKALEIDDKLGEAHSSLASVKAEYDWDWSGSEEAFKRAIELNPNYATAHQWYSEFLTYMGRFDEAVVENRIAQELDPLSPMICVSGALVFYYTRQYDRALEMCQRALELDPNFYGAHSLLALVHLQKQNYGDAIAERLKVATLGGESIQEIQLVEKAREIYQTSGIEDAARYIIDYLEKASEYIYIHPYQFIAFYSLLKDKDQLLDILEKCYQEREWPMYVLAVHPLLDFVRSDARFKALLRKVDLEN